MIDRRGLLAGAGLIGIGASPLAALAAQTPATTPPQPTREERISALARETRRRLDFQGGNFSGPGWDWLVRQGREAHFFLLGEEHGIAENPKLAAALFRALEPAGYSKLAIEISPPMAQEVDRSLASGLAGLRRQFADQGSQVAFYGMREEAEFLAAARAAAPKGAPFLWGTDYEVGADRRLIALLKAKRKPAAAAAALAALEKASAGSWAQYAATRNPQYIYGFSGDPALVRAVRTAWPKPDPEAQWILDTLEETFAINRLWMERKPWESNARRASFMRGNFLRYWRGEKKAGRTPKIFLKYGASHVVRGRNTTETFDLGALIPEIAALEGGRAFHLLVLPGAGSSIAAFDPATYAYAAHKYEGGYAAGLEPITVQALPDVFTLFDTHPLRPLLGYSRTPADPQLLKCVHGFDAILVMSGSTPSTGL